VPVNKHHPASDLLLRRLPFITAALASETTAAAFEQLRQVGTVDPELLRELASLLHAISRGEPANKLFRQNEKTKPKQNRSGVALVYYYVLACTNDADLAVKKAARAHSFGQRTGAERPFAKEYVKKVAQKHRDAALAYLEKKPVDAAETARSYMCNSRQMYVLLYKNGDVTQGKLSPQEATEVTELLKYSLTAEKVSRLREYLRKKSPRRN
jgi:hypothetical protein